MRIFVTGASGFVGSNLVEVFAARHGAEVLTPGHDQVDLADAALVHRAVGATRPDVIVHAAIWNDPAALSRHRRRAWREYVGVTRNVVDAANAVGARVVLVSTDWVFDGTQGPAAETEPPHPLTTYGFLKAASELVVTERAARGTVARIAAVQGVHKGERDLPRRQDAGFGYLVAALVRALQAGEPFTVWDGPGLNRLATPTLASDAADLIWQAIEREVGGILHCCGGEHCDRVTLARRAVEAFGLDRDRLRIRQPPAEILADGPAPADTRLDAAATARLLGVALPGLDSMLARLRHEMEETWALTR